jgi:hypothetical protein
MIHVLHKRATEQQTSEMLEALTTYIKLAVDIQRGTLAGGGIMHADCEAALLEDGSMQEDIWGADWDPAEQQTSFEAPINIRPRQDNPSMQILAELTRAAVSEIVENLLGGV